MKEKQLPKYLQLKQEILSWFFAGHLVPTDQMPSENEIAIRFQMSRQTVRQALGELEQEGWLYRVQGKGTFVTEPQSYHGNAAPGVATEIVHGALPGVATEIVHGAAPGIVPGAFSGVAPRAVHPVSSVFPTLSPAVTAFTGSVPTIGLLTTYISDYIFPHIVRGVEAIARQRGYRLLLSSTDNDKEKERDSLMMMLSQPISGLIIEPTKSAEGNPNLSYYLSLDYQQIPYVMINERYAEMDCPCIKVDDEAGGFLAAEHLIRLGHQRIAGFFKTDDLQGVYRLKGFIRAHRQYQVPLSPELALNYTTEEKLDKPYAAALTMLSRAEGERPTAFVCYNDELALLLLGAVRESGLSVPQDISVVGFDDSSLATATETKLTTLSHPKSEIGTEAAEMIIGMVERTIVNKAEASKLHLPQLVIRDSTRQL